MEKLIAKRAKNLAQQSKETQQAVVKGAIEGFRVINDVSEEIQKLTNGEMWKRIPDYMARLSEEEVAKIVDDCEKFQLVIPHIEFIARVFFVNKFSKKSTFQKVLDEVYDVASALESFNSRLGRLETINLSSLSEEQCEKMNESLDWLDETYDSFTEQVGFLGSDYRSEG